MYIFYTILVVISFVVIGYLFGSVLFGAIIGKLTNVNPRETGSKNVGGTNVSRALGPHFGILVTLLDATKSYLSIIVC
jgi:glycerol-3-phosphate acyltransferase PlsY